MRPTAEMAIGRARLYGILDLGYVGAAKAAETAERMLDGGVDVLQLRAKGEPRETVLALARAVAPLARAAGVPFVVNDYHDIAAEAGADGVHLGQDDGGPPPPGSRPLCFGRSTHSLGQAGAAVAGGAGYIGFGPLFPTPTKPGRAAIGLGDVAEVHRRLPPGFPIFCIGGIKLDNLARVVEAGARRAVIVSELLMAPDITLYIRRAKAILPPLECAPQPPRLPSDDKIP